MTLDTKQKKFLIIGVGIVALYLLGEQKQKNAQKQNKVLQKTPFGFNIGFFDSSRWVDLTPKFLRKVIDNPILIQDLKIAQQNLITLNVNDDRFVIPSTDGNINNDTAYFKENGKYYKQTGAEMLNKIKNEIKIDEWKDAIDKNNINAKTQISNLQNGIHTLTPVSFV
jgi:hypothetical protein